MPPVLHVDTDAPLYDDTDGSLVTDELWGIYYKPDLNFGGVQGGGVPYVVDRPLDEIAVDPYGPASRGLRRRERNSPGCGSSALAHCHKRFEGKRELFDDEPSRWARLLHAGQLPGLRRLQRERLLHRRLEITATR